jgi:hypothetical protein
VVQEAILVVVMMAAMEVEETEAKADVMQGVDVMQEVDVMEDVEEDAEATEPYQ